MKRLLKYLKRYSLQCVIAPLFKFLEACFELVIPLLMAVVIDKGIAGNDKGIIYKYVLIMLGMGVLGLLVALVAQYFSAVAGMGFGTVLRNKCFGHLSNLNNGEIDKLGYSTVVTRLSSDINQISNGVNRFLRLFMRTPFIVIGAVVMSFVIDVTMGLIILLSIPFIVLVIFLVGKNTIPKYSAIQKDTDDITLVSKENLEGVRVIRAFSMQKNEKEKFETVTDGVAKKQVKVSFVSAMTNPLTYAIANIVIVVILYLGGKSVKIGNLTTGSITALINYVIQILNGILVIANLITILAKAQVSANRVADFLEIEPSFTQGTVTQGKESEYKVQFKGVNFAYNQDKIVLDNINFDIKRGETVGIIGGTGSGKSTLVGLIARLYDVNKGEVFVDGVNVKDYTFESLRNKISIATQHATLFKGTVRSNLLFANKDATDERIIEALKISNAYGFVMEKGGLETPVSAKGSNFSGGQRQRLNIARALVKNPEILVLDDSFSALDYATDYQVRSAIKEIKTTTVIVSQRVSSIMNADKIIVLEDGKIVGIGTHDELYNTNSVYSEIYNSQTKENK